MNKIEIMDQLIEQHNGYFLTAEAIKKASPKRISQNISESVDWSGLLEAYI